MNTENKINFAKFGFKHDSENDFDDDGHKFTAYKYHDNNDFLLFKTTAQGMTFFKFKVLNPEYESQNKFTDLYQISFPAETSKLQAFSENLKNMAEKLAIAINNVKK